MNTHGSSLNTAVANQVRATFTNGECGSSTRWEQGFDSLAGSASPSTSQSGRRPPEYPFTETELLTRSLTLLSVLQGEDTCGRAYFEPLGRTGFAAQSDPLTTVGLELEAARSELSVGEWLHLVRSIAGSPLLERWVRRAQDVSPRSTLLSDGDTREGETRMQSAVKLNHNWVSQNARKYPNKWIALYRGELVAAVDSLVAALAALDALGAPIMETGVFQVGNDAPA